MPQVKQIANITEYGYIENGRSILDLSLGSCGCFTLGFTRTDLVDSVTQQLKENPFCQADFVTTNSIVNELSQKLYKLSNGSYPIYSLSGSDAIEGAVKLVQMYWQGTRSKIIGFNRAYHGSTYMSTSLGGTKYMTEKFGKHPNCVTIDYYDIDTLLDDTVAAVFIETASWANGLRITNLDYFKKLRSRCNETGTLLVIDDIAFCGGKTGTIFGFEPLGIQPDIFCIGKGISGGFFPLAVTLCNQRVATNIKSQRLLHGFSYSFPMAGIISTLEYLKILESENLLDQQPLTVARGNVLMQLLLDRNLISGWRSYGVCFSITPIDTNYDIENKDQIFYKHGLHMGIWNFNSKDILIMMPINATTDYFQELESKLVLALTALTSQ